MWFNPVSGDKRTVPLCRVSGVLAVAVPSDCRAHEGQCKTALSKSNVQKIRNI